MVVRKGGTSPVGGTRPRARSSPRRCPLPTFGMNSEALDCVEDCADVLGAAGRTDDAVRLTRRSCGPSPRTCSAIAAERRNAAEDSRGPPAVPSGQAAFDTAWSTGRDWTLVDAIERALDAVTDNPVTA